MPQWGVGRDPTVYSPNNMHYEVFWAKKRIKVYLDIITVKHHFGEEGRYPPISVDNHTSLLKEWFLRGQRIH